jgi:hypothetical protein
MLASTDRQLRTRYYSKKTRAYSTHFITWNITVTSLRKIVLEIFFPLPRLSAHHPSPNAKASFIHHIHPIDRTRILI